MMDLSQTVRPNILHLKPYSSARNEFQGEASVYLDANENPYSDHPCHLNRYPDPLQQKVKNAVARVKGVDKERIFLGIGSDEPIDVLYRVFCEPGKDNAVAIDPTYGMYQVAADINNVEYRKVLLDEKFDFTADRLLQAADRHTKVIFLCSPNNPTGNLLNRDEIVKTILRFDGIVALDEAYIDFAHQASFLTSLRQYPNLIVLQTFSKAWASAAARLGMAFAAPEIIRIMNKVKYPYNINQLTQEYALQMLQNEHRMKERVAMLLQERDRLQNALSVLPCVERLYPTDANFILVQVTDANAIYRYLTEKGVIVRNRATLSLCAGCLRITVGTPQETDTLVNALKTMQR
ncbi:MAG: histidinol-phosphate transaminase [Bacteroidales bacterium]|jgi:histidinol-phosphate aminotransferase|nr:histidinol-phosphate transaminase [Bacteroidales bacterium]